MVRHGHLPLITGIVIGRVGRSGTTTQVTGRSLSGAGPRRRFLALQSVQSVGLLSHGLIEQVASCRKQDPDEPSLPEDVRGHFVAR